MADTKIGAIHVEASIDAARFIEGARKLQSESKKTETVVKQSFSGVGAAVKAGIAGFLGTLSVGVLTSVIKSSLEYASSLGEISQQLGVTTKDLQTLRYAAGQLGVDQQTLDTGLRHLTETLGKVAAGAAAPTKALAAIGLTAKDLAGLDTGEAFKRIADALEPITDRAQRAAVELALFGESGSKLDTMLSGGSAALNELSDAAQRLGIVLSDEQIRKADETADKLDAMKTVLSARIAGIVADNADAILTLADALASVVTAANDAVRAMQNFYRNALGAAAKFSSDHPTIARVVFGEQWGANVRAANFRSRLEAAGPTGAQRFGNLFSSPRASGSNIGQFLAPKARSGGGRRARARQGPRDRSDDVEFQFEQEQRRAEMDILRARQQLAGSYEQRTAISLRLIELEKENQDAELANRVRRAERDLAEGKITADTLAQVKAQADVLAAKNAEKEAIEKQAFAEEQALRQSEATFEAERQRRQFEIDALEFADQMATTQADHRRIQLQILDAQIEQRRLELEHEKQLAERNGATAQEIQVIQDKIDHLTAEQAVGQARIENNTRNPLEEWAASVPQTAQEITEAFQSIQANGLDALADGMADVITGTKSLKEAFHDMSAALIADTIRVIMRMLILKAITAAFGGASGGGGAWSETSGIYPDLGFAGGGSFTIGGRGGTDANIMAINGLPIARVSKGERVSINTEGGSEMMPPLSITMTNDFRGADPTAVAAIQARLNQMEAELPAKVVATVQDARSRFIIRD